MSDVTYRSMMSSSDAIIWNIEADPQLRSTVMAVWELDALPTPERMAANVDRMVAAIPRLRQRVVEGRPRPSWVPVDRVDLDHHVVTDALPAGSGFDEAVAYAERWVGEPFDRSRPLWRLALLSGLGDGRAAAVIKVHHSIADGMGMVLMLGAFTDLEPDPAAAPAPAPSNVVPLPTARPVFTPMQRLRFRALAALRAFARTPIGSTAAGWRTLASATRLVLPSRVPHSRLMTDRSGSLRMDARRLPLADVKRAASANDSSINDVFVAAVADSIKRYHWQHGLRCDRLRVHMPVNSRTARTADLAGNEFVPARITLELDQSGGGRVRLVRDQLTRLRDEPALHHINTVSAAVHRLGKPISRWIIGGMMKGVDVLASNVPGPPFPLFLAGSRIERFVAFGPPAGAALNVTLFSYDGEVHLGITTDAAAVFDRERYLGCLDRSLADLVAVPGHHLVAV